LGLLAAAGLWFALPGRAPAAASEAGQAERQQVKQTLARFRGRFNLKDHLALVGRLPDEPVRKGPGGAYPVVTTAEAEYTVAERKAIRDELKALFRQIPPEVQLFFKPLSITVSGGRARVECEYYFKAKTLTPEAKEYLKTRGTVTVRFKKVGGQWNIEQVKGIIDEVRERIPKAARTYLPKKGR